MNKSTQKEILKWMLGEAFRAKKRKRQLEERLERINVEHMSPIGSPHYDPLPRSASNGDGTASFLFKLADIEDRIYEQKSRIEDSYVKVMDIIEFMPQREIGRQILELRHLDGMSFSQIADAIPMSRSQCYVHYGIALDYLLQFDKVQKMVQDAEGGYIDWCVKRDGRKSKRT